MAAPHRGHAPGPGRARRRPAPPAHAGEDESGEADEPDQDPGPGREAGRRPVVGRGHAPAERGRRPADGVGDPRLGSEVLPDGDRRVGRRVDPGPGRGDRPGPGDRLRRAEDGDARSLGHAAGGDDLGAGDVEAGGQARGAAPHGERLVVRARGQVGEDGVGRRARDDGDRVLALEADRGRADDVAAAAHARPGDHHALAGQADQPQRPVGETERPAGRGRSRAGRGRPKCTPTPEASR